MMPIIGDGDGSRMASRPASVHSTCTLTRAWRRSSAGSGASDGANASRLSRASRASVTWYLPTSGRQRSGIDVNVRLDLE